MGRKGKSHDFLFLNIILHYTRMQSEIDSFMFALANSPSEIDSLKQRINELEAENNIIKAENIDLKTKVAKLEDKQTQNELIKNLLSASRKT